VISGRLLIWNLRPDRTTTPLSTSKSCLMIPICCRRQASGLPTLRAAVHGKHPPSPGAKASSQRKPCPPPGPSHQRHRPLRQDAAGGLSLFANWNTPKFKKSNRALAQMWHSTTPTKSSHPSGWCRTRASVRCGPPTRVANRHGSRAKVISRKRQRQNKAGHHDF